MPLLFTPGQLMAALSLSKQEWRTFRGAFPALNADGGRVPCFTAGDILAAAVVQHVSKSLGMPLSAFSPLAAPLFSVCRGHAWPQMERSHLLLAFDPSGVVLVDADQRQTPPALAITVHLKPRVQQVREMLLPYGADTQQDLVFPPMIAGGRR